MKKIIVFLMSLIISTASFSQQTKLSPTLTKQDYLDKSKNQKTTAWVMLGGGASFILLGDLIGNSKNSTFSDAATGFVIAAVGGLSMLGSIPLFIASSRNKKKAMSVSAFLKMEPVAVFRDYGMIHNYYPALSLKMNLH